jgi:nucleoid DNA-binding protein
MEPNKTPLKSINKTQLVQVISDRLDITRIQAARFLEVLNDIATEALNRDHILIIPDLVQLSIKETAGRPARRGVGFDKQPKDFPAFPAKKKVAAKPVGQIKKVSLG